MIATILILSGGGVALLAAVKEHFHGAYRAAPLAYLGLLLAVLGLYLTTLP